MSFGHLRGQAATVTTPQARKLAREAAADSLGLYRLRPGQEEAIASVLAGHDTLAVLPTGLGKSAIYQVAGTQIPGMTLVVSPLIALQKDQLEAVDDSPLPAAAVLNSRLSAKGREEVLASVARGEVEFLFLAPEQFANNDTLEAVRSAAPSLFVVDEAHCVSEWGHDFRPAYLRLGAVVELLGQPRVLALTATASPPVRDEIVERLNMRDPYIVIRGFDRPNIDLAVEPFVDETSKRNALVQRVTSAEGPGIVYASLRRTVEDLAEALCAAGVTAAAYHAGLPDRERGNVQDRFMAGDLRVIVATSAFGMGVDKPDVRFVYHNDPADSVDSYYQAIGRAGRDGEAAGAVLFYRPEDLAVQRYFSGTGHVEEAHLAAVLQVVRKGGQLSPEEVAEHAALSGAKANAAIRGLVDAGALSAAPDGSVTLAPESDCAAAIDAALAAQERRARVEASRLEMMRGYAETHACRREYILTAFGEPFEGPCGGCDNCERGLSAPMAGDVPFPLQSRVRHGTLGEGLVMRYEGERVVVLFDDAGYKMLGLDMVLEQQLLRQADA